MGSTVNASYDQLWFTLLFRRREWINTKPTSNELDTALACFDAICQRDLDYLNTNNTQQLLERLANNLQNYGLSGTSFTTWCDLKRQRINDKEYSAPHSWGWKEPNTHVFLEPLASFYPQLKYIHVIRHGVDMALSSNQNQTRQWHKWFDLENKELRPSRQESFNFWFCSNRRTKAFCESRLAEQHIWIKYENLCHQPLQTAHKIADFLQIDINDSAASQLQDSVVTDFVSKYKYKKLPWVDSTVANRLNHFDYCIEQ